MRWVGAGLVLLLAAGCDPGPSYDRLGARRAEEAVEVLLALCGGEAVTGATVLSVGGGGEDTPIWRIEAEQPDAAGEPSSFPLRLFATPAGYTEVQPFDGAAFDTLAVEFTLEGGQTSISFELDDLGEDAYYVNALNPEVPEQFILDSRDDFCAQG